MSFHKVTPVKKTHKATAQTTKKAAKAASKKAAQKRRPVSRKS
jgi:hypothetical protein